MDDFYDFTDLKPGMRVNVEGTLEADGSLRASTIAIKDDGDLDEIEAEIQAVESPARTLRVLGLSVHAAGAEIKDIDKETVGMERLRPGTRIKFKGRLREGRSFHPEKIKIKQRTPDSMDEIEATITAVDAASRSFTLLGFRVVCDEDVDIEA